MKTRGRSRSCSNADKYEYNDVYPSTEVKHVRNELEQIRINRGLEHAGCNCRKKEYNAQSHKRHHHRMTERKLKEEIRKRGLLAKEIVYKSQLESILQQAMRDEPCCWGDDCPCARSGIMCHAVSCLCWRSSETAASIQQIQEQCGNRYGMYVVDTNEINAARQPYCHPVSTTTTTTTMQENSVAFCFYNHIIASQLTNGRKWAATASFNFCITVTWHASRQTRNVHYLVYGFLYLFK